MSHLKHLTNKNKIILFWLGLYFLAWSLLPFFLSSSYPLDVPEGIYWGREWQWGYYKHPPLSSWILFIFYSVFGHIGPYLLSQIIIVLTLWLTYRLASLIFSQERAILSSLLLMGIFYYTWPSLEFNHNIAQLPVWIGLSYLFYLATRTNQWRYWLGFGALSGLGMLVKYTVGILLISTIIYSLLTPYRRLWFSPKPWIATLIAGSIFAPHILWLIQHNWLPFTYAENRANKPNPDSHQINAIKFLLAQLINHLPTGMILFFSKARFRHSMLPSSERIFILFFGLFPALLVFSVGFIFNIGLLDMWGLPMWSLSGILILMYIPDDVLTRISHSLRRNISIWLIVATLFMTVYITFNFQVRNKPSRMNWPQENIAQHIDQQWSQLSHCPLDNITGSNWPAILAASYSRYAPSVMISGNALYSPWISTERLHQHGTIVIELENDSPNLPWLESLDSDKNLRQFSGTWTLQWPHHPKHSPLLLTWRAYVPQSCHDLYPTP